MKKVMIIILAALLAALLMPSGYQGLRNQLLQAGLGWTATEWMYYVLLALVGIALAIATFGLLAQSAKWKKVLACIIVAVLPFSLGFMQHPIYEDMLWNLAQDMTKVEATGDYNEADLVVIAIADCPYCKRAVTEMKALHERNPEMRMRMVVCTADSSWVEPYVNEAQGAFDVVMADNMDVMATHAGGHFPAYVQVHDGKPVCRWTNNEWGPVAKDIVEGMANGE